MKKLMILFLSVLLPVCAGATEEWKDQILYFVLVDRFANGDHDNDENVNKSDPYAFHGGDVKGLIKNLDYLTNLGVTGIWLSPVFKNRPGDFYGHSSYHGYWPWNFWEPDPRFAQLHELVELRNQTQIRKMKLLLDMVVNHMGYDAPFVEENQEWFNHNGNISDWNCPEQLINFDIYGLPDFASEVSVVKSFFKLVGRHWIKALQPDGYRLDAVKHVPAEFWQFFNSEMIKAGGNNFFLLGEYLNGDPVALKNIWESGKFVGMFDFPLYYTIKEVFAEGGDCRKIASRLYFDRNYPDAGLLATFIDNHDLDRFMTLCNGDKKKFFLALSFIMSVRGIPTIYYGTEQAFEGREGPKPENRADMIFDESSQSFLKLKKLIELRKGNEALKKGLHCHLFADKNGLAFARLTPDSIAIAAFNLDEHARQMEFNFPFRNDQILLYDEIEGHRAMITQKRMQVFLPAKSAALFFPKTKEDYFKQDFLNWQNRFYDESAWGNSKIKFIVKFDYAPKKSNIYLTGNCSELGNWDTENSVLMNRISDNEFEIELSLPVGRIVECKSFYVPDLNGEEAESVWQKESNTVFEVLKEGKEVVHLNFKTF
jgi:glycosidase